MRHALRLTPAIGRALLQLHDQGSAGMPVDLLPFAGVLASWGLAELYTDERRVLCARIRATTLGDRVASTLIAARKDA